MFGLLDGRPFRPSTIFDQWIPEGLKDNQKSVKSEIPTGEQMAFSTNEQYEVGIGKNKAGIFKAAKCEPLRMNR